MAHALASRPPRPTALRNTSNSVEIAWHSSKYDNTHGKVTSYNIKKLHKTNNDWKEEVENIKANEIGLTGQVSIVIQVEPNCSYRFAVIALYSDGSTSAPSEWSESVKLDDEEVQNIAVSWKDKALALSTVVKEGHPTIHQLNLTSTYKSQSENIRKFEVGHQNMSSNMVEKVIMLVGATGAGKSTFINAMVNYLFDIKFDDDVRLKIIDEDTKADQAQSQTKHITSYTIHGTKVGFIVTIVDTPGFGDSGGYIRDEEISKEMHTFFTSSAGRITHVDAVGFLTQASLPRLTPTQKYIFDKILSLFGKDIKDNILMLFTFADGNEPQVLSGINQANIHFSDYFTFNNTDLFEEKKTTKRQNMINELAWEISIEGYDGFFKVIETYPPRSLILTQEVLEERNVLQAAVISIHEDIKNGLGKLENIRMEIKIVNQLEEDIIANQNYEYQAKEDFQEMTKAKTRSYNCNTCQKTCILGKFTFLTELTRVFRVILFPSKRYEDVARDTCKCPTCGCEEANHVYSPFVWKTVKKGTTKTLDDMKKRYDQSIETKLTKEKLIAELKTDFDKHQANTLMLTEKVRKIVVRLNEIALKPNPISSLEYIDMMIIQEKADAFPGFLERVMELQDLRAKTGTLMEIIEKGANHDLFSQYSNTELWNQVMDVIKRNKEESNEDADADDDADDVAEN
ncbi:unnamed protein product [Owenia fusiformis]|uniref:Uncharacterized protein n=1 Tax=Owenia fusiformis TaxID=6347 RepID=A0A8J1Y8D0_OWEFU|nr:unnamed protein product [Owenia fusiformis]